MSLQTLYFGVAHAFILALGFILMCRNIQECKRLWIYQKEYSVSEYLQYAFTKSVTLLLK
jgi:hypothetical protein